MFTAIAFAINTLVIIALPLLPKIKKKRGEKKNHSGPDYPCA